MVEWLTGLLGLRANQTRPRDGARAGGKAAAGSHARPPPPAAASGRPPPNASRRPPPSLPPTSCSPFPHAPPTSTRPSPCPAARRRSVFRRPTRSHARRRPHPRQAVLLPPPPGRARRPTCRTRAGRRSTRSCPSSRRRQTPCSPKRSASARRSVVYLSVAEPSAPDADAAPSIRFGSSLGSRPLWPFSQQLVDQVALLKRQLASRPPKSEIESLQAEFRCVGFPVPFPLVSRPPQLTPDCRR